MENFYAAAAQVYDWFDLTTLPLDASDSRTENGQTYYRVDCQSYPMPTLLPPPPADSTVTYAATPVTPLYSGGPSIPGGVLFFPGAGGIPVLAVPGPLPGL